MAFSFRHALCNEVFQTRDFAESCRTLRTLGYTGIEIAPFTLADDPASITPGRRKELREIMASEGMEFVGLHWLMVSPKGLHVTTPEAALRARSWLHIRSLIDLCADLGPNGVMIFGSPVQRKSTGGSTAAEATARYIAGLTEVAKQAEERGVTLLIEALPSKDTDVVTSLDEAAAWVRKIGSPAIQTMYDSHNAVEETEPHEVLVERHLGVIRHIHVNEMDGRQPGTGNHDFKPVLQVLKNHNYTGWISLEVFDFTEGAEAIAGSSIQYLEKEMAKLA